MKYVPTDPPVDDKGLRLWIYAELQRIAEGAGELQLDTLHAAPSKPREGLVVMADGTDWDPGSGAGAYIYRGSAWHLLG